jgi:hypothetical protein
MVRRMTITILDILNTTKWGNVKCLITYLSSMRKKFLMIKNHKELAALIRQAVHERNPKKAVEDYGSGNCLCALGCAFASILGLNQYPIESIAGPDYILANNLPEGVTAIENLARKFHIVALLNDKTDLALIEIVHEIENWDSLTPSQQLLRVDYWMSD